MLLSKRQVEIFSIDLSILTKRYSTFLGRIMVMFSSSHAFIDNTTKPTNIIGVCMKVKQLLLKLYSDVWASKYSGNVCRE